ncbi:MULTISPECIES: tyrosine-type recombinase/integrase [unclassified Streptomyces]|uniref:tyrosine-type recombinase/integrase n=1 Tax=unclassified Streptomyces TaxID=2593676 RepID=UPI00088D40F9|nr:MULTISPECIES: tyrosine-type recombinase/integrase [unclassified Streptomyces]PBC83415.1 site-specific recombinase XerD [Streptomyces sp. 2321.6]SDR42601.1 Site-specific recombinase XerD [Streptomyces sp. KS_16]SEC95834.1 Site-specific recombinase XerD [Streptomyces sp. 2133.1]SNC69493.1 Site-specific recombinase XerD [Streptomyces sp. 2114.4]
MGNAKGSRRRFGSVRQYRSGRWTASYLGPDGQEFRAPETFETKKDAEVWLSQIEADLTRGNWQDPDAGAVNFKEYALQWVDERGLAATTDELYRRLLRLHILPTFEGLDLDEITAPRVRTWRTERLASTSAATTVAKSYRLLKAILETAVDDELIRRNPCRIRGAGKESSAERQIATVDQVDALANALGPRWRLMVFLGAYGPMRPEEQAELRRKDVDLDEMTIRVRMAAPELTTGRRAPGDTKSDAGKRLVVLPAFLRTDLRRHLDWYAEKDPDGLLFVGEKGKPFRRSTFGRKWRKARAIVGMPEGFRFYDLRHTGHTLATRSGATLKDTMVRAGQSSEKAALIYQHSDLERQQEVASGLDDLVRAARSKARKKPPGEPSGADLVRDA